MQADFHYYAAYCAAIISGYSHEDALVLCYSDQFVDCCTKTFLKMAGATVHAATSQTQAGLHFISCPKISMPKRPVPPRLTGINTGLSADLTERLSKIRSNLQRTRDFSMQE